MAQHPVGIVLRSFRAMGYGNDRRYLTGDEVPESGKLGKKRRNNVKFYQAESPLSTTSFRLCNVLTLRAFQNLRDKEYYSQD